jgi:cyclase
LQEIAPGVFVETRFRGGNVGAILTDEGFVLIDAPPFPEDARRWKMFLREQSSLPIRALVMTDAYRDRLLGASWFQPPILIAHAATHAAMSSLPGSYAGMVVNSLTRDSVELSGFGAAQILLANVIFTEQMKLHFGKPALYLMHHPGPTKGSIWVHWPEKGILFTGDSIVVGTPPLVNASYSKEWLDSLSLVRRQRFPADIIVPGRGELTTKEATGPVSKFLRLARRRVRSLYKSQRPLSETAMLVHELLAFFPAPLESELDHVQQRVRTALQFIYNEFREQQMEGLELVEEEDEEIIEE